VQYFASLVTGIPPAEGDPAYPYREVLEQPQERYFFSWLSGVPASAQRWYGDPAVRQRDSSLASFQSMLSQETLKLRSRAGQDPAIPTHIMIPREIIHKRNNNHDRRNATREALTHCEFSLTEGAQSLKEALFSVRFQEMTEKTTRPPGTLHDRFSHQVTALEYGMVYEELRLTDAEVTPQKMKELPRLKTHQGQRGGFKNKANRYQLPDQQRLATSVLGTP
jgi:hypothetical protein